MTDSIECKIIQRTFMHIPILDNMPPKTGFLLADKEKSIFHQDVKQQFMFYHTKCPIELIL